MTVIPDLHSMDVGSRGQARNLADAADLNDDRPFGGRRMSYTTTWEEIKSSLFVVFRPRVHHGGGAD